MQFSNLQSDFDKVHGQLEDETETSNGLRSQNQKVLTEYQLLKSKYDKDIAARTDELEETRSGSTELHIFTLTLNY